MPVSESPQTTIYETTIEDAEIEKALEERQRAYEARATANRTAKDAHEAAKAKIDALDLGLGAPARIGRFVVTRTQTEAKPVSFSRGGGVKTEISLLPDAA